MNPIVTSENILNLIPPPRKSSISSTDETIPKLKSCDKNQAVWIRLQLQSSEYIQLKFDSMLWDEIKPKLIAKVRKIYQISSESITFVYYDFVGDKIRLQDQDDYNFCMEEMGMATVLHIHFESPEHI